jgi:hypothetical protein
MKKINVLLSVVLVSLIVLMSGCSMIGGNNGIKTSGLSIGSSSSSKGGVGVNLDFAEGNPSSEIFEGQPVTFAFIFENYQEHEITDLKVKTKGYETGFVKGLASDYSIKTIPKFTESTGPGVYAGQVVSGVRVEGFDEKYNFNPTFDYCYSAKTSFREQICVPNKNNNICETEIEKSQKQNGPLNVKIDRVSSVDGKVRIDFTINNVGNGQVVNTCFNTEEYTNKYSLKATLGSASGNCKAVSGYNIINGKSNFYCEFSRSGDESYASQVTIELDYKYQQSTQKKILVKDLNSGYE